MPRKKKQQIDAFNPNLSRGIIAILILVLAIIVTLSFFQNAGTVGIIIDKWILSSLFGFSRYFVPIVLAILAWFFVKDVEYNYKTTHGIGAFLFFLSTAGLLHLKFDASQMWLKALDGEGGGIFGMFAWPLKTYLGNTAGLILLIGFVCVSLLLLFNTSIVYFIHLNRKALGSVGSIGKNTIGGAEFFESKPKKDDIKINGMYGKEGSTESDNESRVGNFLARKIKSKEELLAKPEKKPEDESWGQKVVIKDLPPIRLLTTRKGKPTSGDIKLNVRIIQETLSDFGVNVEIGEVRVGPTVTQYSFTPARGVRLSKIASLTNNLALALAAHPIRIEAPIPGKSLVGIEVPNQKAALVSIRELLESKIFKARKHGMMIALGKDVGGKVWFADLPKMPHLLIAGSTGSGKTVCMNTVIMSLLFQNTAETLRMIMVDPKRVELTLYNGIPHLLTPVITNTQDTVNALRWTINEMDRRFETLAKAGNRDITSYNLKHPDTKLPHIVFIVDELADLMATAANEVESGIIRLAQMARAVGIHLIVATQRPSVDVITGLMKANIPGRIAFSVASLIDSRTILDSPGAEKLVGKGDMLLQTADLSKPVRIQGAFISEEELKNVVKFLKVEGENIYDSNIISKDDEGDGDGKTNSFGGGSRHKKDLLFDDAKKLVIEAGKASASYLQRRLRVGYARAARLMDELEDAGIIGPQQGSKPRDILVDTSIAEVPLSQEEISNIPQTNDTGAELNIFQEEVKNQESVDIKINEQIDNPYDEEQ
ncbi:MAG: DNA translocase FtsK [Candidatus Magasanikbacteria bacterium]|nr:DNA translocase FtsK [Candidatus Magasanikbacteria bacterium]